MRLSELKEHLKNITDLDIFLPNGDQVPSHYHLTEVGQISKDYIDCGGTVSNETKVVFQLWYANDYDHRLTAEKVLKIISIAEEKLGLQDGEIEVEYQSETIGKYGIEINNNVMQLTTKQTNCLAPDKCNIPGFKKKINLSELVVQGNDCVPGKGCC